MKLDVVNCDQLFLIMVSQLLSPSPPVLTETESKDSNTLTHTSIRPFFIILPDLATASFTARYKSPSYRPPHPEKCVSNVLGFLLHYLDHSANACRF